MRNRVVTTTSLLAAAVVAAACTDNSSPAPTRAFLDGTASNPDIGLMINGSARTLLMFQLGAPAEREEIPFGASPSITPVGLSVRGHLAIVPLGNAPAVDLVDLATGTVLRTFTLGGGNATGSAWVNDTTAIVGNFLDDYVGRIYIHQASDAITDTVPVTPAPSSILSRDGRVFVVSSNLDENYQQIADGVLTEIDPATMTIVDTLTTGGRNPQYGAFGPDNKLYVVNTGDFFPADAQGSLAVYRAAIDTVPEVVDGMGNAPGPITIDGAGRALISSFSYGTIVYNTSTSSFLKGPGTPLCAPSTEGCRTAADAAFASNGNIYQSFFGDQNLPAQLFIYDGTTYTLVDSVAVPLLPSGLQIRDF